MELNVCGEAADLINVLVMYRIGLFFKSTTGKHMTTLEHFHFFNTVPFDFVIFNSILTLKPVLS